MMGFWSWICVVALSWSLVSTKMTFTTCQIQAPCFDFLNKNEVFQVTFENLHTAPVVLCQHTSQRSESFDLELRPGERRARAVFQRAVFSIRIKSVTSNPCAGLPLRDSIKIFAGGDVPIIQDARTFDTCHAFDHNCLRSVEARPLTVGIRRFSFVTGFGDQVAADLKPITPTVDLCKSDDTGKLSLQRRLPKRNGVENPGFVSTIQAWTFHRVAPGKAPCSGPPINNMVYRAKLGVDLQRLSSIVVRERELFPTVPCTPGSSNDCRSVPSHPHPIPITIKNRSTNTTVQFCKVFFDGTEGLLGNLGPGQSALTHQHHATMIRVHLPSPLGLCRGPQLGTYFAHNMAPPGFTELFQFS